MSAFQRSKPRLNCAAPCPACKAAFQQGLVNSRPRWASVPFELRGRVFQKKFSPGIILSVRARPPAPRRFSETLYLLEGIAHRTFNASDRIEPDDHLNRALATEVHTDTLNADGLHDSDHRLALAA